MIMEATNLENTVYLHKEYFGKWDTMGYREPVCDTKKARILKRRLLAKLPEGFSIKRAVTLEQLSACQHTIYEQYLARGCIKENHSGLRSRKWDAPGFESTFFISDEDKIIATGGIIEDSGLGLPADKNFPNELENIRKYGKVCEFTNITVLPEYRRKGLAYHLMRRMFQHAHNKRNKVVIGQVDKEDLELGFYGINMFLAAGEERSDYENPLDSIVLGALPLKGLYQKCLERDRKLGDAAFLTDFWYRKNSQFVPTWDSFTEDLLALNAPIMPFSKEFIECVRASGVPNACF